MSNEKTSDEAPASPDVHFEPIVNLPKIDVNFKALEENEELLLKLRAKLYRFETSGEENEWKERGVGEIKILKNSDKGTYRVLMRRDKTFKICANHYISKDMELRPNCGSDRAWVWTAPDFADEEIKTETLAIRFANAENAKKFKEEFVKARDEVTASKKTNQQESDKLAQELEGLNVKENNDDEDKENKSENTDNETDSKTSETKEAKESTSTATDDDKVKEPETTEDTPEK
ncbi:ran-specific GTPase-activating protein-like [Stylophora pistillata]|uniref:Ran-specific GTPase-activating protein n=1 Tax=Stylophora pistillata TaxID=50429 RepID=A0A2B4SV05_STYPI|nr:ran-specific GTPase-activating protein-like [Stylophora pistillata]PFX32923.1 Ran-specific GTPase-activating protein [Stylophora pistillata]